MYNSGHDYDPQSMAWHFLYMLLLLGIRKSMYDGGFSLKRAILNYKEELDA